MPRIVQKFLGQLRINRIVKYGGCRVRQKPGVARPQDLDFYRHLVSLFWLSWHYFRWMPALHSAGGSHGQRLTAPAMLPIISNSDLPEYLSRQKTHEGEEPDMANHLSALKRAR